MREYKHVYPIPFSIFLRAQFTRRAKITKRAAWNPLLAKGHPGFTLLHIPKHRPRRRLPLLLLLFTPRRPELRLGRRVRSAHLPLPFFASARPTESRERTSVSARFERKVEQLKHVCVYRVDGQCLAIHFPERGAISASAMPHLKKRHNQMEMGGKKESRRGSGGGDNELLLHRVEERRTS